MISVIAGFLSGVISGMGIGGGMILIPVLVFFLFLKQQAAQAVNLWYFLPTALIALGVHTKSGRVEYKKVLPLIVSGIPAAIVAARLALELEPMLLGKLFGGFLGIFGVKEVYDGFTNKK